jgi:transposase
MNDKDYLTMFPITRKIKKKGRTYEYVQIIENYRKEGKIKQRLVMTLGKKDEIDQKKIDALVENLGKFSERLLVLKRDDPGLVAQWSRPCGLPFLYQQLWERAGLADIVRELARTREYSFDVERALFLLVVNRLMDPKSELGISTWKEGVFLDGDPFTPLELQHLYRTLDFLEEEKETIEMRLFEKTKTLFNSSVTLVFFDTTSTYCEGSGKHSKELLRYGRSKDHRSDRKQLVVGVLMDQQGIPLGCAVVPGNTQDVTLVKSLVGQVKERFRLEEVVWVSDAGTAGEKNIEEFRGLGVKFIFGARMKNVKEVYEKVQDGKTRQEIMAALTPVSRPHGDKREPLGYYEFPSGQHHSRRYVIVYNPEEAERERQTRDAVVKKLKETLTTENSVKELIKNKKYRSYLAVPVGSTISVDEDKVKRDEAWDGLFVIQTDTDLSTATVVARYKDLYHVEQAFRALKTPLDMRPIYHRKDRRITAHVFVNFLALYLTCALERMLKEKGWKAPGIHVALADVNKLQMTRIALKEHVYEVRTELEGDAHKLLTTLGISPGLRIRKVVEEEAPVVGNFLK